MTTTETTTGTCPRCGWDLELAGTRNGEAVCIVCEDPANDDAHSKLAELIDEYVGDAVEAYMSHLGLKVEDVEDWADGFRDEYIGEMSPAEYAEQFVEDCGDLMDVPDRLRNYIDFEKMGRDMELGGGISEVNGFLFRNN